MTTKNMRAGPTRDFQVRIQKHDSNTKTRLYVTIPKGVVSVKAYDNEKVRGIPEGTDLVINGHMYGEEGKIPDFVILKIVKYGRLDTENKQKAKTEERDGKVVWLKEPADGGYKYRPRTGNIIIKNNKAYEVISSEYHDTDGFTVGVMNEEWYHIKARDVSDTQKGRELLRKEKSQKQDKKLLLNLELAQSRLVTAIIQKGKYYRGKMVEVNEMPGNELMNTMSNRGRGGNLIIRSNSSKTILISRHDPQMYWGEDNVRIGRGNDLGFAMIVDTSAVKKEIENLEKAKLDAKYGENTLSRKIAPNMYPVSPPRGIRKPKTPVAKKIEGTPKKETTPRGRRDMPSLKTKKGKLLKSVEKTRRGYCVPDTMQSYWVLTDKTKKATQKKASKKKTTTKKKKQ